MCDPWSTATHSIDFRVQVILDIQIVVLLLILILPLIAVVILILVDLLKELIVKVLDRNGVGARAKVALKQLIGVEFLLKVQHRSTRMDLVALFLADLAVLDLLRVVVTSDVEAFKL